jgi:replicative DNA helicase
MVSAQSRIEQIGVPVNDLEAEQAILGGILVTGQEALWSTMEVNLKSSHFYREPHATIYRAMVELSKENRSVDVITVADSLKSLGALEKIGGYAYLSELSDGIATSANIKHYCKKVKDYATLRMLGVIGGNLREKSFEYGADINKIIESFENQVYELRQDDAGRGPERPDVGTVVRQIEEMVINPEKIPGVKTGFHAIDAMTGGFQPSDLIIIAGRPSHGKTSLAVNIATNVAVKRGLPVLFFSLEMSRHALTQRMMADLGRVDLDKIRFGRGLDQEDFRRISEASGKIDQAPIWIDDSPGLSPLEIRARTRRLSMTQLKGEKPVMVLIDFLTKMKGQGERMVDKVAHCSGAMKDLAKELELPVVLLAQLNRLIERRENKRPVLSDLKESGAIEEDADLIFFTHRKDKDNDSAAYEGRADLVLAKHRNGQVGDIPLEFVAKQSSFRNWAQGGC